VFGNRKICSLNESKVRLTVRPVKENISDRVFYYLPLLPPVFPRLAAGLRFESHVGDGHRLIERFAHVIDGERGDRDGRERLHLDAGLRARGHFGFEVDAVAAQHGAHVYVRQRERVTERNEIARALGGHDAGETRSLQRVAFRCPLRAHGRDRLLRHQHARRRDRAPHRRLFRARVHHRHAPLGIHVCELLHTSSLRKNARRVNSSGQADDAHDRAGLDESRARVHDEERVGAREGDEIT